MGDSTIPSMLDLIRLSPRNVFPPGGVELYRHIAILTDLSPGDELLDVACGVGTPLIYWVKEYGVQGSGVEADSGAVARAEDRIRDEGIAESLQVQQGSAGDLPYRDEIFDVAVGEMGLTADTDPEKAIRELVRVTKPGGSIVLVQLVWKAPVDPPRRKILSSHLGARPVMLVELKRILRESGVRDLHTEDWSDEETAFRSQVTKPFPDFAELFSIPEKLGILRRAWQRWGWNGVKTAVLREREVHRLLTRERIIALDLVLGTREGAGSQAGGATATGGRRRRSEGERAPLPEGVRDAARKGGRNGAGEGTRESRSDAARGPGGGEGETGEGEGEKAERGYDEDEPDAGSEEGHEETAGLPLFGGGAGEDRDG